MSNYLVEVQELKKYFTKTSGFIKKVEKHIKAVDNVSFGVQRGEQLVMFTLCSYPYGLVHRGERK